jgi:hypothetical protein
MTGRAQQLIFIKTEKRLPNGKFLEDDYDVRLNDAGRKIIGRILWTYGPSRQSPWYWTITVPMPQSRTRRGYAATRDEAMAQFAVAYRYNEAMLQQ